MKVLVAGLLIVTWLYLLEAAPPQQGFLYKATKLTNTSLTTHQKGPQCQLVRCGVGKKGPSGCACDNECGCRGDCCADFWPVCTGGQRGCGFEGCGGISCSGGGCSCERDCACWGTCCDDFIPVCTGGSTGCLFEGCGVWSCTGHCSCKKGCEEEGNCCPNYHSSCT